MLNNKTYGLLLSLTLLSGLALKAQVAKDDFRKIDLAYKSSASLSMNVNYTAYADYSATAPLEVQKGEVKVQGSQSYHKIGPIEIIQNNNYTLTIDNEEKKIIMLGKIKAAEKKKPLEIDLEKLLGFADEIKYSEPFKGKGSYELSFASQEYSKVIVIFSRKTFFIEKIILYYLNPEDLSGEGEESAQQPRMEIDYLNVQVNASIPSSVFTYEKYLDYAGGKIYTCRQEYRAYSFIDQISPNEYGN
jgi:hypothetical protein